MIKSVFSSSAIHDGIMLRKKSKDCNLNIYPRWGPEQYRSSKFNEKRGKPALVKTGKSLKSKWATWKKSKESKEKIEEKRTKKEDLLIAGVPNG